MAGPRFFGVVFGQCRGDYAPPLCAIAKLRMQALTSSAASIGNE
jgi:hypothetical protein